MITCQVKELLLVEHFILPKGLQVRKEPSRVRRLPMSTQLIHRNLVTANSSFLGGYIRGYSHFTRLHVVLMTNLKLKGVATAQTVYGDYVKDG